MKLDQPKRVLLAVAIAITCAIMIPSVLQGTPGNVQVDGPADRIVVHKHVHTLTLYRGGKVLKTYRVALGRGGLGPKVKAGDNRVPEGVYKIVGRNAHSAFHRALKVSYPNPDQIRQAHANGVNPGGDIMVHGIKNGFGWIGKMQRQVDWTKGCVAVTDPEMEEIWRFVPDGTTIEIDP